MRVDAKIEVRSDSVIIDGYVNAVGRDSRAMTDKDTGEKYVEQIMPGAFMRALMANDKVDILLDHDANRKLGDTQSNLTLFEDAIGLKAHAEITDPEVVEEARDKKLRGWSFGFYPLDSSDEYTSNGTLRRFIEEMELVEVSLIDERMTPAYAGTSVEVRADGKQMSYSAPLEIRADYIDAVTVETPKKTIDYSDYDKRIPKLMEVK